MARKVDASLLAGLVQSAEGQEVVKGASRTSDPNFQLFTTPVNENVLVYIPKTNITVGENGEEMKMLESHLHDWRRGKQYGQLRCINGLSGGLFEQLGYDGTCPACEGMKEVWELYNKKLATEAKALNLDPQNDPNNILKPAKDRIRQEMDLSGADEYVTFPIVLIPLAGKMQPTPDAKENLKVVFVHWKKKRYKDSIESALDNLIENPGHPAGMFWMWNFTYDTQGKPANARDSAKNAKYTPITDAKALERVAGFAEVCEEVAKEFTVVKAAEVVIANQFMYKEDLEVEINKVMAKTREMLTLSEQQGMNGQAQLSNQTGGQPNLGGFTGNTQQIGVSPVAGDLGTTQQGNAQQGANPVQFG